MFMINNSLFIMLSHFNVFGQFSECKMGVVLILHDIMGVVLILHEMKMNGR